MAADSAIAALERVAVRLGRRARWRYPAHGVGAIPRGLPSLWFITDPARTPDPAAIAARLPKGCGVIYRGFGAPDAQTTARALKRISRRRGLVLLIGADEALARRVGADGVHLPQRLAHRARRIRKAHPRWRVTAAAHGGAAIHRAARYGAQAVLVSAVFPSRSPSAGAALGTLRFEVLAGQSVLPAIALGGINRRTAARLGSSRAAGIACVDGFNAP